MKIVSLALVTCASVASGAVAAADSLPSGNAAAGARVFVQCSACHTLGPSAQKSVGPMLDGVVGRRAASVAGYRYSSALRRSGLVWDAATLTSYLRAPTRLVPGTAMLFPGLAEPQDVADVIAFLNTRP